jgi:hypothetical protein
MFMYFLSTGGPVIVPGTKNDVLIGLVLWWGLECGRYPSVFARVSSGYNWFKRIICEESSAPPSDICEVSYAPTTAAPSLSPTISSSPTVVPVEGYSYVGEGFCLDERNEWYPSFAKYFNETDLDYRVCLEWCAQIPHPDFVGASLEIYVCLCHFSSGLPDEINITDYDPSADSRFVDVHSRGYGSIQRASSDTMPGTLCYRYDVSLNMIR